MYAQKKEKMCETEVKYKTWPKYISQGKNSKRNKIHGL